MPTERDFVFRCKPSQLKSIIDGAHEGGFRQIELAGYGLECFSRERFREQANGCGVAGKWLRRECVYQNVGDGGQTSAPGRLA